MSSSYSGSPHLPPVSRSHARNGDTREVLTATLLGLGLMALTTVWWWFAMR